jgi:hypothetical protein
MKLVDMKIIKETMIIWKGKPHNKGKVIEGIPEDVALKYVAKGMGEIQEAREPERPKKVTKTNEKKEDKGGDE